MILCLGTTPTLQRSMTFARVVLDDVNRAARVSEYASGKSLNCARVAHGLGTDVLCLGLVGGDRGRALERDLDEARVTHDFTLTRTDTRLCVTVIDEAAGTATELIEEAGPVTPGDAAALLRQLRGQLPGAKVLVLSGSLATGVGEDFYATCVEAAMTAGVRVIVDAKGVALARAVAEGPLVVKPNRRELGETVGLAVGTEDELRAALRALHEHGADWIAVTNGSRGTTLSDGERVWRVSTPEVKVISAIGSGDSFAAGLAVGIWRGKSVVDACVLAAACGSANALTDRAGHVNTLDVSRLRQMVRVDGPEAL